MARDILSSDREIDQREPELRDPGPAAEPEQSTLSRERELIRGRTFAHLVSPDELATMRDIGSFRTVACRDLEALRYQGRARQMQDDLASLSAQGLIQRRTARITSDTPELEVLVLTKRGKSLLEDQSKMANGQRLYSGFVKPGEVAHDAAIYRMYHAEKAKIEGAGGRIRRVVLDYELKQKIYSPLGKAQSMPPRQYAQRQAEVARENGLKVVRGKIPLPDLRIEYETRDGDRTQVDLELATHHYHGRHLRDKAQAGFKMYAPQDSVSRLTSAFDPEFTAQIFSL